MRTAFWLPEPTDTHSEHVILLYQRNSVCTKSPHCYILRRLPIFFNLWLPLFVFNIYFLTFKR